MDKEDCILLGTLTKTHGISGGLLLVTRIKGYRLKEKWEAVFLEIDGILVPFFVSSFEPGGRDEMIVYFDDITTRELASQLTGLHVYIQNKDTIPQQEMPDYKGLVGYLIVDRHLGEIGLINEIIEIPGNDLAVLDYKGVEIQIPIQDELFEKIDHKHKTVHMILPEGLLEI